MPGVTAKDSRDPGYHKILNLGRDGEWHSTTLGAVW